MASQLVHQNGEVILRVVRHNDSTGLPVPTKPFRNRRARAGWILPTFANYLVGDAVHGRRFRRDRDTWVHEPGLRC